MSNSLVRKGLELMDCEKSIKQGINFNLYRL